MVCLGDIRMNTLYKGDKDDDDDDDNNNDNNNNNNNTVPCYGILRPVAILRMFVSAIFPYLPSPYSTLLFCEYLR